MADDKELDEAKKTEKADKIENNKKSRKEKKLEKKLEKEKEKNKNAEENEETEGGNKAVLVLVTLLIIVIWLGIIALLIKADVGGFGSSVLQPILKDVPVINKILPASDEIVSTESESGQYSNVGDAVEQIKELEKQLDAANSQVAEDSQTIDNLNSQVADLSTYKEDQAAFEEEKQKYYEEVVFSDKAPDIKEYKAYYESIDSENAEVLYKQVVQQLQDDQKVTDYANTYASMKPKEAAAIFDSMTDNFDLVAKILGAMDSDSRANILGAMNSDNAAKITKIMNPS